jgi:MarR family transcriptional regulator for hemolysin
MPASTDDTIGFLVVDVARLLRRRFEAALEAAGLGVTAGEARALHHAAAAGSVRQALIAERMAVEPMTLVGYLDRLEKAGLVERTPDPADRRAKLVRITPAADAVMARIAEIALDVRRRATTGMSTEEVDRMREGLKLMRGNLGDAQADTEAA